MRSGVPWQKATAAIRGDSARLRAVTVSIAGVAVTGHDVKDGDEYRNAGFVKFLRRPIRVEELLRALAQACPPPRASTN